MPPTLQDSFMDIKMWLKEVEKYSTANVCKVLIGNKSDLTNKRVIDFKTGKVCNTRDCAALPWTRRGSRNPWSVGGMM